MSDWAKRSYNARTQLVTIRHAESNNNVLYDIIRSELGKDTHDSIIEAEEAKRRDSDCTLSAKGFTQAQYLGEYFKDGGYTNTINCDNDCTIDDWVIICSPMKRCCVTAQEVSKALGNKKVIVLPDLYECGGCYDHCYDENGVVQKETKGLSGRTVEEIEAQHENFKCCNFDNENKGWYRGNESESILEFRERCKKIVDWLWSLHETEFASRRLGDETPKGFKNIILVGHGLLNSNLIAGLMGCQDDNAYIVTHNNTGVSKLELITIKEKRNQRVAVVKGINITNHLDNKKELFVGDHVVADHWIQEIL